MGIRLRGGWCQVGKRERCGSEKKGKKDRKLYEYPGNHLITILYILEPLYHTVESSEGGKECGNIQGRTGEENPDNVYSVLEEKRAPENCGDEVSRRTRDDDPERVYSVLEDEDDESDYLKILPEPSDYEQPLDPPIPDI